LAQGDYAASPGSLTAGPSQANTGAAANLRTGLYGTVMKGNAAADNTVDDLTKRPHLIEQQYLAGWGGNDLLSAAFNFQAADFNWFGAAYGGAVPDEVRFGLASAGHFGAGVMVSLAKFTSEDSVGAAARKSKTVLENDGFGLFGSFALGGAGDVYGEVSVYTGFDDSASGDDNYTRIELSPGGTSEVTPRLIHVLAGWKKDATSEGTHSLNAELILNIGNWENAPAGGTSVERKITDIQLWFYHGYILKDAGSFKVFAGTNSEIAYQDLSWDTEPKDRSALLIQTTPNMSFQKTLKHGFEGYAGAGFTLAWLNQKNLPANLDKSSSLVTAGADMALGLRWVYENLAVEGALKDAVLANGPYFIGGNTNQGLFGQVGLTVGF